MLVVHGNIATHARCSQLLEAFMGKGMESVLKLMKLENGKLVVKVPGEAKERVVELQANVERGEGKGRVLAVNDLGIQGLILEVSCREEGSLARLSYDLVINPVALGISARLAKLAIVHIEHGLKERLSKFLRSFLEPYSTLASDLLNEEFESKAIAKGALLEKFEKQLNELRIEELCSKYANNAIYVVAKGSSTSFSMIVLGGLFAARLRIGNEEFKDREALEKLSSVSEKGIVELYAIDKLLPPSYVAK